tara:strand:+ start:678 stop:851 length:174 start_codon:yes stop_codon:yes gene_type:complete
MKEIKAFLSNHKDLYMVAYLEEMKKDKRNLLDMREYLNVTCVLDIILQGLNKQNGKK